MVLRIFSSQRLALLLLLLTALQLSGCAVSPRLKPSDQPSVARKTFVITGASSGSALGVSAWSHAGWTGTCAVGVGFGLAALAVLAWDHQLKRADSAQQADQQCHPQPQ